MCCYLKILIFGYLLRLTMKTHEVISEGEAEPEEILAAVFNAELHTNYGGAAVRWGLAHHKESAADCCQACLDQTKHVCETWRNEMIYATLGFYCPSEFCCYFPFSRQRTQNITLKTHIQSHTETTTPKAPTVVPWVLGVVTA